MSDHEGMDLFFLLVFTFLSSIFALFSGVSCDSCLRSNFRGKRYKCLICFDYDLCSACHDSGTLAGNHNNNHPMQCIITRNDIGKS